VLAVLDWERLASVVGVPTTILLFMMIVFWRVFKSASPLVKQGFEKHLEFVDAAAEATKQCAKSSEETQKILEKMHDNQICVTKAFHHTADALEELAGDNPNVKPHTEAIKRELGTDERN
jgi:hypothetical protein